MYNSGNLVDYLGFWTSIPCLSINEPIYVLIITDPAQEETSVTQENFQHFLVMCLKIDCAHTWRLMPIKWKVILQIQNI